MPRTTNIINISAPPSLAVAIAKQAKKEGKTKSELLRSAFELYVYKDRMSDYQKLGRVIAEKLNLESYDDIEKYFG